MQINNVDIYKKLDAPFASKLSSGDENEEVDFFIRATHPITVEEIKTLENSGCTVSASQVNKDIATASAKLGSIPNIASLDFIRLLNLSVQMHTFSPF